MYVLLNYTCVFSINSRQDQWGSQWLMKTTLFNLYNNKLTRNTGELEVTSTLLTEVNGRPTRR